MERYIQTDQYIHQICQVLAKLGRTLVPQKSDDSHTNLYFEPLHKRIIGRRIKTPDGPIQPSIQLEKLSFQWINSRLNIISQKMFEGKNYSELEHLVMDMLHDLGLESNNFRDPLHFNIPEYTIKDEALKKIDSEALTEWSLLRGLANHILQDIGKYLSLDIEVRIWPHHFDTGIYFQWTKRLGVGAGLSDGVTVDSGIRIETDLHVTVTGTTPNAHVAIVLPAPNQL